MEINIELELIAARLEGLEETIISKLIDRAQYKVNESVYIKGKSGFEGAGDKSLLDIRLRMQEEMDSQFGRYRQPEERPFTTNLPHPKRKVMHSDRGLHISDYNLVNVTKKIGESYLQLVKSICAPGDDNQHGSSVVTDIYALQAIAERVHFGSMFVAESKFSKDPKGYITLIENGDTEEIMAKLTRIEVEEKIIARVKDKVAYAQARVNTKVRNLINPEAVLQYYRDYIIPLTKEGEIQYLMKRIY